MADMLFLDHGDLQIQAAPQIIVIRVAQIHIKIHGLLLAGGDDQRVQLCPDIRRLEIHGIFTDLNGKRCSAMVVCPGVMST